MPKPNDGGPAFPRPFSELDHGNELEISDPQDGMSLRAWLVGQALSVITWDNQPHGGVPLTQWADACAGAAIAVADAVLRALEKDRDA